MPTPHSIAGPLSFSAAEVLNTGEVSPRFARAVADSLAIASAWMPLLVSSALQRRLLAEFFPLASPWGFPWPFCPFDCALRALRVGATSRWFRPAITAQLWAFRWQFGRVVLRFHAPFSFARIRCRTDRLCFGGRVQLGWFWRPFLCQIVPRRPWGNYLFDRASLLISSLNCHSLLTAMTATFRAPIIIAVDLMWHPSCRHSWNCWRSQDEYTFQLAVVDASNLLCSMSHAYQQKSHLPTPSSESSKHLTLSTHLKHLTLQRCYAASRELSLPPD